MTNSFINLSPRPFVLLVQVNGHRKQGDILGKVGKGKKGPNATFRKVAEYPSELTVMAQKELEHVGFTRINDTKITVKKERYRIVKGHLPDPKTDVRLIVTSVVARAAQQRGRQVHDLFIPGHAVKGVSEGNLGEILGYTSLLVLDH